MSKLYNTSLHVLPFLFVIAVLSVLGQSEYKQYVSAIKHANQWEELINMIPAGVLFVDDSGIITYSNPEAVTILNRDPTGKHVESIMDEKTRGIHKEVWNNNEILSERFRHLVNMPNASILKKDGTVFKSKVRVRTTEVKGSKKWLVFFDPEDIYESNNG